MIQNLAQGKSYEAWPIEEFVWATSQPAKAVAVLAAYFDDSGTHDQSKVTLLAGLVASTIAWARLERPWKAKLKAAGVSHFHAVRCEHGNGEFEGIDRPRRDFLNQALAQLIVDQIRKQRHIHTRPRG